MTEKIVSNAKFSLGFLPTAYSILRNSDGLGLGLSSFHRTCAVDVVAGGESLSSALWESIRPLIGAARGEMPRGAKFHHTPVWDCLYGDFT